MTTVIIEGITREYPDNYQIPRDDEDNIIIPDTLGELQLFLQTIYDMVEETGDRDLVRIYNEAADIYNQKFGSTIYSHIKNRNMATKKKAAAKKAPAKKAATKKSTPAKTAKGKGAKTVPGDAPKKKTQKEIIVELAGKGLTVDEIVAESGIQKPNVASWFSRLKLGKK